MLGAVLNPASGEHFEAEREGGARLNGAPLRISERRELAGARLLSSRTEMKRRDWPKLIPEGEFTAMGSLAYKLALVAAGRFDGLISLRVSHDWDLAAAALLIGEAGGRISEAERRAAGPQQAGRPARGAGRRRNHGPAPGVGRPPALRLTGGALLKKARVGRLQEWRPVTG